MNTKARAPRRADIFIALIAAFLAAIGAITLVQFTSNAYPPYDGRFDTLGRDVADVALVDSTGAAMKWGDLNGAPRAVFFGFTHCPEVCPTTIADLSASMERLGGAARNLKVEFVTADPARDTPASLHDYLDGFGPQFRGYSGAQSEIDKLMKSFGAGVRRIELEGGDYTLDHTTAVYLVDRTGRVVDIIGYQSPPDRIDGQLRRLLRS